jgi:predicted DNA-binding transcriptional regulator YafY
MPAFSKQRQFDILREVLALAEEQGTVSLEHAAAEVGLDVETLRALLASVLYLEFRTGTGEIMSEVEAFLLTDDGRLLVTDEHWLRAIASAPPDPDTALRLLVAGLAFQSIATGPTPDLDRALVKLRSIVAAHLHLTIETPPCLRAAQDAWRRGRSLRFRYVPHGAERAGDREVLPFRVYSRWGHWYLQGREVGQGDDTGDSPDAGDGASATKQFRVDRMTNARVGDVEFDPPLDSEIPEWFDLHEHERTVTLRLMRAQLDALPRPHRVERVADLPGRHDDRRIEADVVVIGDRALEYLLVCLDPDVEVVTPAARELQRTHAARLLATAVPPAA